MNCRLSCGANRKAGKIAYTYEIQGIIKKAGVYKIVSTNVKENVLEAIIRGMKGCKDLVSHDDLLIIEVQNQHLAQWLSGEITYKGYEEYLDRLFDTLESMDCRYKFMYIKHPYALSYLETHKVNKTKMSSISSLMEEFI